MDDKWKSQKKATAYFFASSDAVSSAFLYTSTLLVLPVQLWHAPHELTWGDSEFGNAIFALLWLGFAGTIISRAQAFSSTLNQMLAKEYHFAKWHIVATVI